MGRDLLLEVEKGGRQTPPLRFEGLPFAGRHPNVYAGLKTAESMIPYARYLDPEERRRFQALPQREQSHELLMENLNAVLALGVPPILKGVGRVVGPVTERLMPKTFEALTKTREIPVAARNLLRSERGGFSRSRDVEGERVNYQVLANQHGVTFNGLQERLNKSPLPVFTDPQTKGSFVLEEGQSLGEKLKEVRGRFTPPPNPLKGERGSFSTRPLEPPPPFYSKLEKGLEGMPPKMPLEDLKKWLKDPKRGVSDDEIKNVLEGLAGKKVVTKEEVIGEVKTAGTRLEDVVLKEHTPEETAKATLNGQTRTGDSFRATEPKYSAYQELGSIPGSYREMFVTAPGRTLKYSYTIKQNGPSDYQIIGPDGTPSRAWFSTTQAASKEGELLFGPHVYDKFWKDGHAAYSNVPNPIVRIRFNDRDVGGKKILFVEEMQGPSPSEQRKMPDYLRKRIYDIGTKRVLSYAKQNGYDGVAWTTGEIQTSRYDLSTHITRAEADSAPNVNNVKLAITLKDGGVKVVNTYKDQLDDVVGKELAKKIINDEGEHLPSGTQVFRDLDLKVGGEGLKRLYDQTLPGLFKKYGKEEVSKIEIPVKPIGYGGVDIKPVKVPFIVVTSTTPPSFPLYSTLPILPFLPTPPPQREGSQRSRLLWNTLSDDLGGAYAP